SRRRHTRCYRDWSSDVCSSDLFVVEVLNRREPFVVQGNLLNPLDGEGANLSVGRDKRKQIQTTLCIGQAVRMDDIRLGPFAGPRVVGERGHTMTEGGFERPRDDEGLVR